MPEPINPNPQTPKSMTEDEIKDFVVKAVNGAVSTHLTRALDNKLEEYGKGMQESILGALNERLEAFKPKEPAAPEGKPGENEAIKNLQAKYDKEIAEVRAQAQREREAREMKEAEVRRSEEISALRDAAMSQGVPAPLAAALVNILHGQIERDSTNGIQFVSNEEGPTGKYQERVAVTEGVKRYLNTEDGKHFLPARAVGGSGNPGGNAGRNANNGQVSDGDFLRNLFSNDIL